MKKSLFWLFAVCLLATSTMFTACEEDDDIQPDPQNLVEFAQSEPNFSLLAEAVVQTGLDGILSSDGPFTLFAPTNTAFQAFLDAAGTGTVANTPNDVLTTILTNHVLGGEFPSGALITGYASTLSATDFGDGVNTMMYVKLDNGVTINGSVNVTTADIAVTNGVIHVVDAVIEPATLVTFATSDPNFSSLAAALTATGLNTDFVNVLSGAGPYTVFAPTNTAFQTLLDSNPSWNTLSDIPTDLLETVLLYHVTGAGNVRSDQLSNGQQVTTLANGATFTINLDNPNAPVIVAGGNTANILATDVQAQNGVVHVIDTVILPE